MLDELLNLNIIHNSIPYFFVFLISILTTSLTIPFLIKYAKINSLYDLPNSRKFNNLPTIRIGGISIILGFYFSILFVKYVFSIDFEKMATKRTFSRPLDLLIPPFSRTFKFESI